MSNLPAHSNLGLLPERKRPLSVFVTSYGAQAIAVILLIRYAVFAPVEIAINKKTPAYIALSNDATPSSQPTQPAHPKLQVKKPPVIEAAKVRVPEPVRQVIELPKIAFTAPAPVLPQVTPKPIAPVVTGAFSTGSSATPTVKAPVAQVQTGGFGDPNGLAAKGDGRGQLIAANVGAFDLPEGAGQGNGTGGLRGIPGAVASAGFGSGVATQRPTSTQRAIQRSGFSDSHTAEPLRVVRVVDTQGPTTPVEIISKPKPVYTDEARQLRLEGEVLVEVVFMSSGQVHAIRVVKGLGHGLDEAALRAAEQIRFKPAQRDGRAVDSTAILHVVFQIA